MPFYQDKFLAKVDELQRRKSNVIIAASEGVKTAEDVYKRQLYPSANITPIDSDPSATKVNQENRIKLMLAVAKERLNAPVEAKPLTAEEIAGGAVSYTHLICRRIDKMIR